MPPSSNTIKRLLASAHEESDVRVAFAPAFQKAFRVSQIDHHCRCDGYIENIFMRLIIEFKFDEDFSRRTEIAKVLVQVLYYLKLFELDGRALPNVVFVGDKNECFVLHSNPLLNYLDEDIDWTIAPSNAAAANMDLVMKISRDANINPFIIDIDDNFQFDSVISRIEELANNETSYVRVTEHNLSLSFENFVQKVIRRPGDFSPSELVAIYMGTITDKENYFRHPSNPNKLLASGRTVDINGANFDSFFSYFDRSYSSQERNRFTEIADRLIEDTQRRRAGEFYTPTPFVDHAHRMLESVIGEEWKDEFVVWDNCWGTGNLTRDYRFRELYISNIDEQEMLMGSRYNRNSTKFVFDFLNDNIEPDVYGNTRVPEGLRRALEEDRPFVFFLNPPYARNSGENNNVGTSDEVCFTAMRTIMNANNMGVCVSNLYAQFLYRMNLIKQTYNLTNVYIAIFCPTLYLTGESWKNFRAVFLQNFEFIKACTFKASYFADVAETWGIAFSIWKAGETTNKNTFPHTLIDLSENGIIENGVKYIYNVDNSKTASVWLRKETRGVRTYEAVELTSAIRVRTTDGARQGRLVRNALGYFQCESNNVDKNTSSISLFTTAFSHNVGTSIIEENFHKVVTLFSARKLIAKNWMNSKDEYLAPNEQHEKWQEFYADSIVYSIFHPSGNQSALRRVEYHGRSWNIKNSFFFMSKQAIMNLAEENNFDDTYEDARTDTDRFVFNLLQDTTLSPEGQAVLEKAIELTKLTFPDRAFFDQEHPEYQIKNWDCGWYQIKALIAWRNPTLLDGFNELFQTLSNKMRPVVYEVGFLKG